MKDYFNLYQKKIDEFGGKANLFKFKDHILKNDSVLGFGCGGGFLLSNLDCKYKAGIGINSVVKLKLKVGGKLVVLVPLDSFKYKFKTDDINKHLYSFSSMNLENILQMNGYNNIKTENVLHKGPPFWLQIQKYFGWRLFHIVCYIYGHLNLYWSQTKAMEYK